MTDDELFANYGLLRETASLLRQLAGSLEGIGRAWRSTPRQVAELKMHTAAVARLRRQSQTTITSESVQRLGEFFNTVLEWPENERANFQIAELDKKCVRMFTDFGLDFQANDWGRTCNWDCEFNRIAPHLILIVPACEKHDVIAVRLAESVSVDWDSIAAACEDAIEQPGEELPAASMIVAGPEKPPIQLHIDCVTVGRLEIANEPTTNSTSEAIGDLQPLKGRFNPGQCPQCQSRLRVTSKKGSLRYYECLKCGYTGKKSGS